MDWGAYRDDAQAAAWAAAEQRRLYEEREARKAAEEAQAATQLALAITDFCARMKAAGYPGAEMMVIGNRKSFSRRHALVWTTHGSFNGDSYAEYGVDQYGRTGQIWTGIEFVKGRLFSLTEYLHPPIEISHLARLLAQKGLL